MKIRSRPYVFQMADDGAGAGGAPAADAATTGAADGTPAVTAPVAAGSLLAAGADTPAPPLLDQVPEKYRVLKADGTLDADATLAKQAAGYNELAKRIGTGDKPPATPEEYAPELPEGVTLDELKADPLYAGFLKGAHAKGLSNEQVSYVLNEYLARAPEIAAGAREIDADACATALKATWTDDAAFQTNLRAAYRVTAAVAAKAGIDMAAIEKSSLANNPDFVRLMAALGPEFEEGQSIAAGSSVSATDFDAQLTEIRNHPAYADANHPEHKAVMQRKADLYTKRYGNAPAPGVTKL